MYLSVVGDKLDLDIGSSSGELGDSDTGPSGLGVGHQFLVDLDVSVFQGCCCDLTNDSEGVLCLVIRVNHMLRQEAKKMRQGKREGRERKGRESNGEKL